MQTCNRKYRQKLSFRIHLKFTFNIRDVSIQLLMTNLTGLCLWLVLLIKNLLHVGKLSSQSLPTLEKHRNTTISYMIQVITQAIQNEQRTEEVHKV